MTELAYGSDISQKIVTGIVGANEGVAFRLNYIRKDAERDLVLFRFSPSVSENFDHACLASEEPNIGDAIGTLGFPLGLSLMPVTGTMNGEEPTYIVSNIGVTFGNSGSGVYNLAGELVGIVKGGYKFDGKPTPLAMIVPIGLAMNLLNVYPAGEVFCGGSSPVIPDEVEEPAAFEGTVITVEDATDGLQALSILESAGFDVARSTQVGHGPLNSVTCGAGVPLSTAKEVLSALISRGIRINMVMQAGEGNGLFIHHDVEAESAPIMTLERISNLTDCGKYSDYPWVIDIGNACNEYGAIDVYVRYFDYQTSEWKLSTATDVKPQEHVVMREAGASIRNRLAATMVPNIFIYARTSNPGPSGSYMAWTGDAVFGVNGKAIGFREYDAHRLSLTCKNAKSVSP